MLSFFTCFHPEKLRANKACSSTFLAAFLSVQKDRNGRETSKGSVYFPLIDRITGTLDNCIGIFYSYGKSPISQGSLPTAAIPVKPAPCRLLDSRPAPCPPPPQEPFSLHAIKDNVDRAAASRQRNGPVCAQWARHSGKEVRKDGMGLQGSRSLESARKLESSSKARNGRNQSTLVAIAATPRTSSEPPSLAPRSALRSASPHRHPARRRNPALRVHDEVMRRIAGGKVSSHTESQRPAAGRVVAGRQFTTPNLSRVSGSVLHLVDAVSHDRLHEEFLDNPAETLEELTVAMKAESASGIARA
ncbi:hypothetical protein C8R45DRAFT_1078062 [Mycena sanguinolenta]|nr:hypothetical protein C8R45DRAFT_1078062 [Mycena sanguinolenta]